MKPSESNVLKSNSFSISSEGLQTLLSKPKDQKYPQRHITWTDDFTI